MNLEPTKKSPEIDQLLSSLFGIDRIATITKLKCVSCNADVSEDSFKNRICKKEYTISGLCQTCQDKVFQ